MPRKPESKLPGKPEPGTQADLDAAIAACTSKRIVAAIRREEAREKGRGKK